jgi:nitroreductase
MDLEEILKTRYATKLFDGRQIEKEKLEKLFDLILLTPSSYNLQPWKIKVVEDQETKEKLFAASFNQKQLTTCSAVLVLCADLDIEKNISKLEKKLLVAMPQQKVQQFIDLLKNFAKSMDRNQRLIWAQKQVYLLAQTTLLVSKYLGLDSCPMEGFDPVAYSKILNLPDNLVPTLVIPIGYAADKPRPKIRLEKKDILF